MPKSMPHKLKHFTVSNYFNRFSPLNIGATRNADMVPELENCPKKAWIKNIGSE